MRTVPERGRRRGQRLLLYGRQRPVPRARFHRRYARRQRGLGKLDHRRLFVGDQVLDGDDADQRRQLHRKTLAGQRDDPRVAAPTATGSFQNQSGYAGIEGPIGSAVNMNVYYALIENSSLPSITVGGGLTNGSLPAATAMSVAPGATWDLNGTSQTVALLSDGAGGGGSIISSAGGSTLTLTPDPGAMRRLAA